MIFLGFPSVRSFHVFFLGFTPGKSMWKILYKNLDLKGGGYRGRGGGNFLLALLGPPGVRSAPLAQ